MKKTASLIVVLLALAGLASCAKYKFGRFGEQETVLLPLRYDEGTKTCKLVQRTPPEIRTRPGREVTWIVLGGVCEGQKIGIDARRGGTQDLFEGSPDLEGKVPGTDQVLRLTARVKGSIARGHYRYRVLIDDKNAEYNSEADEGSLFVCPEWPCGGFKEY